jgi:hypothetical protein
MLVAGILLLPVSLYSDTIDVLSQTYSISGNIVILPDSFPFSMSDSSPVALNGNFGEGGTSAYATGDLSASFVSLGTFIGNAIVGESSAQITFRPIESGILDVHAHGGTTFILNKWWNVVLEDLTTSTTLINDGPHSPQTVDNDDSFQIPVISSHTYLLKDSAAGQFFADVAASRVEISLTSVPDPCNTMLLVGIGFVGLAGLRRFNKTAHCSGVS